MIRHRAAVVILALLALSACSDDDPESDWHDGSPPPATSAAAAAPEEPGPLGEDSAPPKRPEISKNPDGTVNSGGPRPATRESTLNAGGLGPYRIGIAQSKLTDAKLVSGAKDERADNCTGYVGAKGTGRYQTPALMFFEGRLLRVTTEGEVATDKGVKAGTSLADVQKAYPDGTQLDSSTGLPAWLAEADDYALLFEFDNGKVSLIHAGMTEPMRFRYADNQGC